MPIDAKPLRDLFNLGKLLRRRDEIVRAAYRAGVSKSEIAEITSMTRATVDRILDKPADEHEGQDDEH